MLLFVSFVCDPFLNVLYALKKQEIYLIFTGIMISSRLISLIVGGLLHDIKLTLFLLTISGILSYAYVMTHVIVKTKVRFKKILKELWIYILLSLIFAVLLVVAKQILFSGNYYLTLGVSIILAIIYYLYLLNKNISSSPRAP
jgi:hypothetical protein